MGPDDTMNLEGGVLYYASPRFTDEPICLGKFVSVEMTTIEPEPSQESEEWKQISQNMARRLREGFSGTIICDISTNRAWRRIRRIMRKARQQAKRRWEKRKRTGGSLYDC